MSRVQIFLLRGEKMSSIIFVILAAALAALGLFGGNFLPVWSALNQLISFVMAIIFLVVGLIVWFIKNFYVKPSANEAYVITGMGGRRVLIDQGSYFMPIMQELVPVSLETMKLEVERLGTDALITKDNLRVDVRGEFYIKVLPDQDAVINAARSLGEKSVNAQSVKDLVFEKLVSALRSVAATKDLVEIHAQRDEFASAVQELVTSDLEQNGLTLESVTVSRFDQTSQELLLDNNIFDAQGKRKITEITQAALVERNRIEQDAKREITMKNVNTKEETLGFERRQAEAEAIQEAEIAKVRSERNREAETYRIDQQRLVREAEIAQEEAVQRRAIERDKELVLEDQALQTADIARAREIELAERQKEIQVADAERLRAEAEKSYLEAKAAREEAEQAVVTIKRLAEADRLAETELIAAKQKIEEDRIRQETEANVEAFTEVKKAEASKASALLEAEATLSKAQAEAEAKARLAKGETALKRVDVDIEREKVNVEAARVEVERQALENKEKYSSAAIEYEIHKLRIEANRDVQMQMANAIAEFMSRGNMQIFGSPETMSNMMSQYAKGMGIGQLIDGTMEGADGKIQDLLVQLQAIAGQFKASSQTDTNSENSEDI